MHPPFDYQVIVVQALQAWANPAHQIKRFGKNCQDIFWMGNPDRASTTITAGLRSDFGKCCRYCIIDFIYHHPQAFMERKRTYEWESPLETAEKAKSLSGLEFLKSIQEGKIPVPPVFETMGFEGSEVVKGKVSFSFEPKEFHYNPIGSVHGGVISTILDSAMGCTVHSILEKGYVFTTLELKVNFLKAVTHKSGRLTATGKLIHSGRSTALVEASLVDESGKVFAHGTSTCLIIKI